MNTCPRPLLVLWMVVCAALLLGCAGEDPALGEAEAALETVTLAPVADAYVSNASGQSSTNFGSATTVKVDGSPLIESYLRFDVSVPSGATITGATLRLYTVEASTSSGWDLYAANGNGWDEGTITWANQPGRAATSLGNSGGWSNCAGDADADCWTDVVLPAGSLPSAGLVSYAITTTSSTSKSFHSREGVNDPQLVVTYAPPTLPSLTIADVSVTEGGSGATNANFTVTLSAASASTVTVAYATSDGTAAAPGDYTATSGTLSFAPGQLTQTVAVPVVGDTAVEPDETFRVDLSNATNAGIADAQGTGTITNDDAGGGPQTLTLAPVADATVSNAAGEPGLNFGAATTLKVDGSPLIESYLRFDVSAPQGATITGATLRLYAASASTSSGWDLYPANGNGWGETTITWANQPGRGATSLGNSGGWANCAGDADVDCWTDVPLPAGALPAAGLNSYAIATTSTSSKTFHAREGVNAPQLVVTYTDAGPPPPDTQPTFPGIRAAFYYPWFPEAWSQQGYDPFTRYTPAMDYYSSADQGVVDNHLRWMKYAKLEAGIYSWWGQGSASDQRLPAMLARTGAVYPELRWAVYYECEGNTPAGTACPGGGPNPTQAQIHSDLQYIKTTYGSDPRYLRIQGKPVVFVYNADDLDCTVATRYADANAGVGVFLVLKVFDLYGSCADQPDSWHQYAGAPSLGREIHLPHSYMISPGFHRVDDADPPGGEVPYLARDLARWEGNVQDMHASTANWHLVVSLNEWGEGSQVEPSVELGTDWLDALATNGQAQPAPAVVAGAGDVASNESGGYDEATATVLDGITPLDAIFVAGDGAYPNGALTDFTSYYEPTWGRHKAKTRPAVGNHEYRTAGASGYFDYWNGVGVQTGVAGTRGEGWYSYNVGAWHVVVLSTNGEAACATVPCGAGSAQEQWLRSDLAASNALCTLAYLHHPRKSTGTHGDNPEVQPLYQALYDHGVDVIVAGHDHNYQRWHRMTPAGAADPVRGMRQFVVGTGGKAVYAATPAAGLEVYDDTTFGVLKLTLRPARAAWSFLPIAGQSFSDSGVAYCR